MKLTTLLTTQPAADTGVARAVTTRPYDIGTGIACGMASGVRNVRAASWTAISRTPMLVPTFHDRWPLSSTT